MKRWPTRFELFSAECQLTQSKLVTHQRLAQIRSTVRARLAQPSTLFMVASLGYLFGARLARRNEVRAGKDVAPARRPIVGIVYTLLIRFGLQRLAEAWTRHRHSDAATVMESAKP